MNKNIQAKLQKLALLLTAVTIIFSTSIVVFSNKAFACSCAYSPDPKKGLEAAQAVFSGEVIDIKKEVFQESGIYQYRNTVLFKVIETWKGVTQSEVIVRTFAGGSSSCGNEYKIGTTYLVFANGNKNLNILETSICSPTKEISTANDEIDQLGQGKPSLENVDLKPALDNMKYKNFMVYGKGIFNRIVNYHMHLVILVCILLLLGLIILLKNSRRT